MMMLGAKLTKTVMGLQEKLLQSEIITNKIDFSWLGIWGGGSGWGRCIGGVGGGWGGGIVVERFGFWMPCLDWKRRRWWDGN